MAMSIFLLILGLVISLASVVLMIAFMEDYIGNAIGLGIAGLAIGIFICVCASTYLNYNESPEYNQYVIRVHNEKIEKINGEVKK